MNKILLAIAALLMVPMTSHAEDTVVECVPDCEGKECGDDGCEGECGPCDEGYTCNEGQEGAMVCEAVCTPDCEGKECGDDGCGGDCGSCDEGSQCVDGEEGGKACEEVCTPNCENKTCGDDGCGTPCGVCLASEACLNSNCVPAQCLGACEGTSSSGCQCDASCYLFGDCCEDVCVTCGICGPPSDETPTVTEGCGQGSCAGCCDEFVLDAPCQCDASCVEYGDCCEDACELCGVCDQDQDEEECPNWLGYEGCCLATGDLAYCNSAGLWKGGPCPEGLGCGWNAESGYYDCVESPQEDPNGVFPQWCSEVPGFPGGSPKPDVTDPEEDVVEGDATQSPDDAESDGEGENPSFEEGGEEGITHGEGGPSEDGQGAEGDVSAEPSGGEGEGTESASVEGEQEGDESPSLASSSSDDGCSGQPGGQPMAPLLGLILLCCACLANRQRGGA